LDQSGTFGFQREHHHSVLLFDLQTFASTKPPFAADGLLKGTAASEVTGSSIKLILLSLDYYILAFYFS
jgi:hypothetical protein